MTRTFWTWIALAGAVALTTSTARAAVDDDDAAACNGAVEGDSCTEADGEAGICRADPDDDGRLECEDLECDGLSVGDVCTDSDGEAGVCRADTDDQGHLECDDDASSTSSVAEEGGCAVGAGPGSAYLLLALGAAAVRARRRTATATSRARGRTAGGDLTSWRGPRAPDTAPGASPPRPHFRGRPA